MILLKLLDIIILYDTLIYIFLNNIVNCNDNIIYHTGISLFGHYFMELYVTSLYQFLLSLFHNENYNIIYQHIEFDG